MDRSDRTKEIDSLLKRKPRWVGLMKGCEINIPESSNLFQATQYDDAAKDYLVIEGPFKYDGNSVDANAHDTMTYTVHREKVEFIQDTLVICHGLKKAKHLNGNLAWVGDYVDARDRYIVHFEDENLKPVEIKPENLHIVFDLSEWEVS